MYQSEDYLRGQKNGDRQGDRYQRDFDRDRDYIDNYDGNADRGRMNQTQNDSPDSMEWVSTYDRKERDDDYSRESSRSYRDGDDDDYRDDRSRRGRDRDLDRDYRNEDPYRERSRSSDRERYRDDDKRDYSRQRDWDRGRESDLDRDREIDKELERARYGSRRDRDRSLDRDRDRDRDRSRHRDRSGERDRRDDRDRGRNRERDRDRDRGRDRDRDRRRDDRSDRDRDYDDRKDRRRDSYERDSDRHGGKMVPSPHIMIRGLASVLTNEVAFELQQLGLEYKDIKIVKNRYGESRGFAFVDFYDVKTAEKWMEMSKGFITIGDHKFPLEYSKSKTPAPPLRQQDADWYCSKCRTLNYASRKRVTCFSCGEYRKDMDQDDFDDGGGVDSRDAPISAPPCNVLMMRGLDTQSSEETIRNSIAELTSFPIYDVRLIKDKVTGMSRGFCFIEFGSTEDATEIMKKIQDSDPAYFIDGRRVTVGYAKNTPYPPPKQKQGSESRSHAGQQSSKQPPNTNIASVAIAQAQAAQLQGQAPDYTYQQQPQASQYAQGAPASQQATDSSQEQLKQQPSTDTTKQPTAVAGPQQQQPQSLQGYTYDPASGYYYDATTGLYYDANTGYYFNSTIGKFLYWDAQKQQYLVVNQDGTLSSMENETTATSTASPAAAEKVKAKPTGSSARKIAKDMERWAKKTNEAKMVKSNALKQAQMMQKEMEAKEEELRKRIQDEMLTAVSAQTLLQEAKKASAKSMFAADDDDPTQSLAALLATKTGTEKKVLASSLVAEYGDDSDEEQVTDTQKLVDFQKLTCLLCKRQFQNKEILLKHTQVSDLHKQNLILLKQKKISL